MSVPGEKWTEILKNPKHEFRNPKQIRITKIQNIQNKKKGGILVFNLELRISRGKA